MVGLSIGTVLSLCYLAFPLDVEEPSTTSKVIQIILAAVIKI